MSEQVRRKLKVAMQENARLQAEVEMLTERNQHLEQIDSYLQSANLNAEEQRSFELEAQVERLTKACKLVFDESAKRKFLMCYRGNDFYVSLQAMEAMSVALGYSKAKKGVQS